MSSFSIKDLDFLGSSFQFTFLGNKEHKTWFGSIISILCFAIQIVAIIFFGSDFFNRTNPSVVSETVIPDTFSSQNVKYKDLNLAFRIQDFNGNYFNYTKNYNLIASQFNYYFNESSTAANTYVDYLPVVCNETTLPDPLMQKGRNLSEWLCFKIPPQGIGYGGAWDADFIQYLTLRFTPCYDDAKQESCANFTEIQNDITTQIYFSIMYPQYYYSPDNFDSPLNIRYVNYEPQISNTLYRRDTFYLQNIYSSSDQGWILQDLMDSQKISFERQTDSYSVINMDFLTTFYGMYYSLELYMDSDYMKFRRSYMKIQDLAAVVGGFMKMIIFASSIIIAPYNNYMMRQELLNLYFSFEQTKSKKENLQKICNGENDKSNCYLVENNNLKRSTLENNVVSTAMQFKESKDKINEREGQTHSINNFVLEKSGQDQLIHKEQVLHKTVLKKKDSNLNEQIGKFDFSNIVKNLNNDNKKSYSFGLCNYLKYLIGCKNSSILTYNQAKLILDKKLDISHYLKMSMHMQRLDRILLNQYQRLSLGFMERENINNSDEFEIDINNEKNVVDLTNYYTNKIKNNSMEEIDLKFFEELHPTLKSSILQIVTNLN